MPAPQELKTALLQLLDEAYDTDGTAISRPEVSGPFVRYDDSVEDLPETVFYKVLVDASSPGEITVRIRPRSTPLLIWPL